MCIHKCICFCPNEGQHFCTIWVFCKTMTLRKLMAYLSCKIKCLAIKDISVCSWIYMQLIKMGADYMSRVTKD